MRIAGTGLVVKTGPADDHAADDDDHAAGVRGGELDEECAAEEAEAEPPAPTGFCFLVAVVTVVLLDEVLPSRLLQSMSALALVSRKPPTTAVGYIGV